MIKKINILILLAVMLTLFQGRGFTQFYGRINYVIDTPTAYTLEKGMYNFTFLAYDRGGVELKAFMGLHDNFYLGASFDIQSAIGKEEPEPHAPGVIAKIKFTDGLERFPISVAIGYDSFYIGQEGKTYNNENKLNRMIYGPYIVVTKPIYLLDEEQHLHFGFRVPLQPYYVPEDSSYFVSFDIPIGNSVIFKAEGDRIYHDLSRREEWMLNVGLKYSYLNRIGVEFDLLMQKKSRSNRVLRIEYNDEF
ncbi:MAG: hypothetical protein JXN64_02945 [Spirochaetes bacterium]|nr:hypothetical protein [Spirochaetota bacterium]